MNDIIKKHEEDARKKRQRVYDLKGKIEGDQQKLQRLKSEYENAVINNADSINDLFHEMDAVEKQLKADKHQLETLEKAVNDSIRNDAIEIVKGFDSVKQEYEKKGNELLEKVEKAKQDYVKALQKLEIDKVWLEYEDVRGAYSDLLNSYEIEKHETGGPQSPNFTIEGGSSFLPLTLYMTISQEDIRKNIQGGPK